MKKQFGKLKKAEQEAVEQAYHQMNPQEFDQLMTQAKRHAPDVIRLSPQLVDRLKEQAKSVGESEYQAMVERWIEERLQQETLAA
jgi:hypothetical protein